MQIRLEKLKLVSNADKSKLMIFLNTSVPLENIHSIRTTQGETLELVTSYKYLGFIINEELSFKLRQKFDIKIKGEARFFL